MNTTVYCGANLGTQDIYKQTTSQLGKWIATHNHVLVYGGGKV